MANKRIMQSLRKAWKKTQTLSMRLDEDADTRLDWIAQQWGCSRGEVVRRLIKQVPA